MIPYLTGYVYNYHKYLRLKCAYNRAMQGLAYKGGQTTTWFLPPPDQRFAGNLTLAGSSVLAQSGDILSPCTDDIGCEHPFFTSLISVSLVLTIRVLSLAKAEVVKVVEDEDKAGWRKVRSADERVGLDANSYLEVGGAGGSGNRAVEGGGEREEVGGKRMYLVPLK